MLTSIPNTVAIGTSPETVAVVRYAIWMYVGTYETTENRPTPMTVDRTMHDEDRAVREVPQRHERLGDPQLDRR